MSKPIDFDYIQSLIDADPDRWWPPEIAELRFEGLLKRMMGIKPTDEEEAALALGPND